MLRPNLSQYRKAHDCVLHIQITAKFEEANESSYTIQSTGEVVSKVQLSLVVPGMRDRILCDLPLEKAPKPDLLDRWELEESWLVVSADGMRALAFDASTLAQAFAAGIEERWTAENRAHARILERELRSPTSARSKTARSRGPVLAPARSFRTSLAALAGVVLLASGLVAALAVQHGALWSVTPTSQILVVSTTVPERLPATATHDRGADVVMRYSGSQVWALWPDGSRRWTVWVDAALAGPPMVLGDLVAMTTVIGTRYTVRVNDGVILSRVLAAVTPGTGNGHHGEHGNDNEDGN